MSLDGIVQKQKIELLEAEHIYSNSFITDAVSFEASLSVYCL